MEIDTNILMSRGLKLSLSQRRLLPARGHQFSRLVFRATASPYEADNLQAQRQNVLRQIDGENNVSVLVKSKEPSSKKVIAASEADIDSSYSWEQELGKGGNAVIHKVKNRSSGTEFACKTIDKLLKGSQWSDQKRRGHLDAICREVEVLHSLRESPNVARLEQIFEDDSNVYIIMELCRGGEIEHRIGYTPYTEVQVARIMRTVLQTIAECHANNFLHRDIKPGNFLFLDKGEAAVLKAIDFGLAVPYCPENLPLEDLGLEGTAWYMAPEVLSSSVEPKSDVWSAGIMAAQLLTGRFPYDDYRNPFHPSVTKIWQAILSREEDFKKSCWSKVSVDAKGFVGSLLQKDLKKRPTAEEALLLPWLQQ